MRAQNLFFRGTFLFGRLLVFIVVTSSLVLQASGVLSAEKKGWEMPPRQPLEKPVHKSKVSPDDPEALLKIIKNKQAKNVRESYGEFASQCFTDDDLSRFIREDRPSSIARGLKKDKSFLSVVGAIKKMHVAERKALFERALATYKLTWAELGKISREGQTEAGQKAERLIAETIVNLAKESVGTGGD
jgi:hypothetical protein